MLFSIYRVLLIVVIIFITTWSMFGMYTDSALVFRYMNYAGYFLPYISAVFFFVLLVSLKGILVRVLIFLITLPGILLPVLSYNFDGNLSYELNGKKNRELNVLSFSKMSRNVNYEELLAVLNCDKYDVIAIQEFPDYDEFYKIHGGNISECYVSYDKKSSKVILSKYPVSLKQSLGFASISEIYHPDGIINIFNVRLDKTLFDDAIQTEEVNKILEIAGHGSKRKLILLGDFNSTQFNNTHRTLIRNFRFAREGFSYSSGATFPSKERRIGVLGPLINIDRIYYRGFGTDKVKVLDRSYGSDHYPVMANLTY